MQLAQAELSGDRQQQRRQHIERRQPFEQHADHDQKHDRADHEDFGAVADGMQEGDQALRQIGDGQRPREPGGGREDEQQHASERRRIGYGAHEASPIHLAIGQHR